jgi:chromosome segregation ATPase
LQNTQEELKERNSDNNPNMHSLKDKEQILTLQNQLKENKYEIEEYAKKCKKLEESLESFNSDQLRILSQYTEKISQLSQENALLIDKDKEREVEMETYKEKLKEAQKQPKGKVQINTDTQKLKEELILTLKQCKTLSEKLEQSEQDHQMMTECNRKNKVELGERILALEEQLKAKEEALMDKEGEVSKLKSSVVEQTAMLLMLTEENKVIKKEIEDMRQNDDSKLVMKEQEDKINALNEVVERYSKEIQ